MDGIKNGTGASGLGGSLGGSSKDVLSTGFTNLTPKKLDPWEPGYVREDDAGNTSVGDRYAFSKIGACGRPNGNER